VMFWRELRTNAN